MTDMKQGAVNVNNASEEDLINIKGIGAGLAKRIVTNRPYEHMDDLIKVSGINETKLSHLLPFITLGEETAVVPAVKKLPPVSQAADPSQAQPVTKIGDTEAFVFLEDKNDRQDALLIILGGFVLGLMILFLHRSKQ